MELSDRLLESIFIGLEKVKTEQQHKALFTKLGITDNDLAEWKELYAWSNSFNFLTFDGFISGTSKHSREVDTHSRKCSLCNGPKSYGAIYCGRCRRLSRY